MPVKNYESNYAVSNLGNVKNIERDRIMKATQGKHGYLGIILRYGPPKHHLIHRLVAQAFLENKDDSPEVDHINNIKTDNRVENLRWISSSNNLRNRKKYDGCSSKFMGVCFNKQKEKYQAELRINGKKKHLGRFDTEEEAHEAWKAKIIELGLTEFYKFETDLKISPPTLEMSDTEYESDAETEMPTFNEEPEAITMTITETTTTTIKKRGRKPAEKQLTEEEKKERMRKYYEDNKAHRLAYKQVSRGKKAPENKCSMHTSYLPKQIRVEGKKPITNLDWMLYSGVKRTITISQPSDAVIMLLKQNGVVIEESVDGTLEL